jgi:prefoldin subunit 4
VKKDDQLMINEFGKLNNRLLELRADNKQIQDDLQVLEDASTDVMMAMDGKVRLQIICYLRIKQIV